MSLRLIVMRHAKSDWTDPFQDDHDRVLNPRGQRSATALGRWLADQGYWPDCVLCSSAARTQETWARIAPSGPQPTTHHVLDTLYLARAQTMLNILRARAQGSCVLLIAHNPGIGQMAQMLARTPPNSSDFQRYPTGYSAVLDFEDEEWAQVDWAHGNLIDHIGPRSLPQTAIKMGRHKDGPN